MAKSASLIILSIFVLLCLISGSAEETTLGSVEGMNDVLDEQLTFLESKLEAQDDFAKRIENAKDEELADLLKELQNSIGDIFGDDVNSVIQGLEDEAKAFRDEIPTEEEIAAYNVHKN